VIESYIESYIKLSREGINNTINNTNIQ